MRRRRVVTNAAPYRQLRQSKLCLLRSNDLLHLCPLLGNANEMPRASARFFVNSLLFNPRRSVTRVSAECDIRQKVCDTAHPRTLKFRPIFSKVAGLAVPGTAISLAHDLRYLFSG
jgi:hypothetical protein